MPADAGGVPAPPAPEVLGYRVVRLLGVGGSGAVWLVRDDDGASFALKVPAAGQGNSMNAFEARREVNIHARLEHPHLLKLHGVVETDQGAGLLTGYAPGGSAAGLVAARGPVLPGEAVTVLVGIAAALDYLHARGTAHGDVSPGNILFASEGRPLLADFGSGRLLGESGASRQGTPGFHAPESDDGTGSGLGTAGDVYALAAVGWFLLTGRVPPPSRDRPPLSILVPGVGRDLPALLEAGLAEDPGQRPTADEFAAAAYRGAPALPVDLVAAVHPDVRPQLLTRRTGSAGSGTGRRRRWWHRPTAVGRGVTGRAGIRRQAMRGQAIGRQASGRQAVSRQQEAPPAGRRRRDRNVSGSRVLPVAATGVVALVLILAGIALAAPDLLRFGGAAASSPAGSSPATSGSASPGPVAAGTAASTKTVETLRAETKAEDAAQALPALAELRSRAFRTADPALLNDVDAPGSEALLADREQIGKLSAAGHTLDGLVMEVSVLDQAAPDGTADAELRVHTKVAPYRQVDRAGAVLQQMPAQEQEVLLVLVRVEGTWRISSVVAPS
ncbi:MULTISPECIES: serine/threonine-protein kinase [unclassified Arthrobacter]|uniref:serine/threonine-protein kinase n=1 Tax=unclassified Arthrobacter TaxID=235627 RepID=UPI001E3F989A|nr:MULTISPECIES: serine/threonine-protein kinase [unclassified Arthrobacter]MCC9145074.1 serine/threonine protein kinase [Arthrobacter sp. zg-Y919]MDK1276302.1 serine/threonine-protein kinase [Arthrobacter sp. zg.Y919]WIB02094.1 serine/threonine-protein kinase [Arthrobacter sp. zg-Y919]